MLIYFLTFIEKSIKFIEKSVLNKYERWSPFLLKNDNIGIFEKNKALCIYALFINQLQLNY